MKQMLRMILALVAILLVTGCDGDDRLARMATESAARQAEQNRELVRLNREVAEGTKLLVDADSRSREELVALQRDLQAEQAEIGGQRDSLERERKALAQERQRDSVLAAVLVGLGESLVGALPLILCWYLLHGLRHESGDEGLAELLVEEIASEQPKLLPREAVGARPSQEPDPLRSLAKPVSQAGDRLS